MTQETQVGEAARKSEFADRLTHFDKVAQGIESLKRDNQAAAASVKVMCSACLGAGGWGSGEDAEHCATCGGSGKVSLAGAPTDCPVCAGTNTTFGKPCDHHAEPAEPVASTIDINKARRFLAKLPVELDTDLRECAGHLKDAPGLLAADATPGSWKEMYFAQCAVTDELHAKLEEGSDKALLARIAELQADLATMNARYAALQAAGDVAAMKGGAA
jgi:hypothetical protein